jgi:hypothetical protein
MTGPAAGKLELKDAKVYVHAKHKKLLLKDAMVYIHLKGYALARVTHLDIEHEILDSIIPPKNGKFLSIHGIKNGFEIILDKAEEINYEKNKIEVEKISVLHPYLAQVLEKNEKTRTWVGGKFGGIYIGFRKKEIEKLENLARERFNFQI